MTRNSAACSETSDTLSAACSETSAHKPLTCVNGHQCRKCRVIRKVSSRTRVTYVRERKFRTIRHSRHCWGQSGHGISVCLDAIRWPS
jgi:hypothetical protein